MRIEITIPITHPWRTLCILVTGAWIFTSLTSVSGALGEQQHAHDHEMESLGGAQPPHVIAQAQGDMNRERIKQAVLERREEILRYELEKLEEEAMGLNSAEAEAALREHRNILITLIRERQHSEELLKASLEQLWEAQGVSFTKGGGTVSLTLDWPVEPRYGISAGFEDGAYERRFGIPHHAVDIPVEQGTVIVAPADGIVTHVRDNGLGYSSVTVAHEGGMETIYGHVSGFIAREGERIYRGEPLAYSGGRPGSPGAGLLTTGPHLHFAVKLDGKLIDPMRVLRPAE